MHYLRCKAGGYKPVAQHWPDQATPQPCSQVIRQGMAVAQNVKHSVERLNGFGLAVLERGLLKSTKGDDDSEVFMGDLMRKFLCPMARSREPPCMSQQLACLLIQEEQRTSPGSPLGGVHLVHQEVQWPQ